MNPKETIHQYLLGNLDQESVDQLDRLLADDPVLRREFAFAAEVDAALREASIERTIDEAQGRTPTLTITPANRRSELLVLAAFATLAAALMLAIGMWVRQPSAIATLASSEDAAWESELPTSPGSELVPGTLRLKSGIATIEFRSGAELIIESPACIELVSEMRAKLISGAALIEAPERAKGFTLETPDGYAVDFGTRFSVVVDEKRGATDFELLEGEIEVQNLATGESRRLTKPGRIAAASGEALVVEDDRENLHEQVDSVPETPSQPVVYFTRGRCRSVLNFEKFQDRRITKEFLFAKTGNNHRWDYRSVFAFETDQDRSKIMKARLRLNLVPSPYGLASLLPRESHFAIYGVTDPEFLDWQLDGLWSDLPGPENVKKLGTFTIERSQTRGVFGIEGESLVEFINQHGEKPISFVLVRETGKSGEVSGKVLVHAFASNRHPEAVGPALELVFEAPAGAIPAAVQ